MMYHVSNRFLKKKTVEFTFEVWVFFHFSASSSTLTTFWLPLFVSATPVELYRLIDLNQDSKVIQAVK